LRHDSGQVRTLLPVTGLTGHFHAVGKKVELSLFMLEGMYKMWRYTSIHFWPHHELVVNGELHAMAALTLGKIPQYPLNSVQLVMFTECKYCTYISM